jgi:hypothetical protein
MKVRTVVKSVIKKASVMVLAAAALLVQARAARAEETVVAKVPFAFVVNGVVLPAGDYVITRDTRQPGLIAISSLSGERRALTLTRSAAVANGASEQPKLEFERIGNQVFLSEITLGPGASHEVLLPAAAEDAPRK